MSLMLYHVIAIICGVSLFCPLLIRGQAPRISEVKVNGENIFNKTSITIKRRQKYIFRVGFIPNNTEAGVIWYFDDGSVGGIGDEFTYEINPHKNIVTGLNVTVRFEDGPWSNWWAIRINIAGATANVTHDSTSLENYTTPINVRGEKSGAYLGLLIGGVTGGIMILVITAFIVGLLLWKRRTKDKETRRMILKDVGAGTTNETAATDEISNSEGGSKVGGKFKSGSWNKKGRVKVSVKVRMGSGKGHSRQGSGHSRQGSEKGHTRRGSGKGSFKRTSVRREGGVETTTFEVGQEESEPKDGTVQGQDDTGDMDGSKKAKKQWVKVRRYVHKKEYKKDGANPAEEYNETKTKNTEQKPNETPIGGTDQPKAMEGKDGTASGKPQQEMTSYATALDDSIDGGNVVVQWRI